MWFTPLWSQPIRKSGRNWWLRVKNPIKQAAIIGFDVLLLALLGLITVDQTVQKATARLHMTGAALMCPYAEVGMDVDKPVQLEIIRADLAKQVKH